jgi:hypothetical protein
MSTRSDKKVVFSIRKTKTWAKKGTSQLQSHGSEQKGQATTLCNTLMVRTIADLNAKCAAPPLYIYSKFC